MVKILSDSIKRLAKLFDKPLYVVGGCVRDYLISEEVSFDVDLTGAIDTDEIMSCLEKAGLKFVADYPKTGTLVFKEKGKPFKYEFTAFRKDVYSSGGSHKPKFTIFTDSIEEDALRRDFKCNAVYYNIITEKFIDPLNGIEDIKNKVIDTVKSPSEVFCSDGLRLLRLARFTGELGFKPTNNVLASAKEYASNIKDVSGERIFAELEKMLIADKSHSFSKPTGHYDAFKVAYKIGVLNYIFPELSLGESMPQRKDFHKYDVLEHSFRTLLYSDEKVRLAALLHDIGKPVVYLRDGTYHLHSGEGEKIARQRLKDLHVSKKMIDEVCWLIAEHMYDLTLDCTDYEVKKFIATNYTKIEKLLLLKEADIKASRQDLIPQTVVRWKKIIEEMKESKTPFSLSELAINGNDLLKVGVKGKLTGIILNSLLNETLKNPQINTFETLIIKAEQLKESLS